MCYILTILMLVTCPISAAAQTLARLSVRVAPGQVDSLKAFARDNLHPLLAERGLTFTGKESYLSSDSLYVSIYKAASASVVADARDSLQTDREFEKVLTDLEHWLGPRLPGAQTQGRLLIYKTPFVPPVVVSVPGLSTVKAGKGRPHVRHFDVTTGLSGPMVTGIVEDKSGQLWVATSNNGVCVFDGSSWRRVGEAEGLTAKRINALALDLSGRMWITTEMGVFNSDGATWEALTGEAWTSANKAQDVASDSRGNVWFGSRTGLIRYDGKTHKTFTTKDGLISDRVFSISEGEDGRMVFAGPTGVSIYDPDPNTWERVDLSPFMDKPMVARAQIDRQGRLWVSTVDGLYRRAGEQWVAYGLDSTGIRPPVLAIEEDSFGTMWIGGPGGVARLESDRFVPPGFDSGSIGTAVQIIYPDREGNLWLGSQGGLSLLDTSFVTFGPSDGLPSAAAGFVTVTRTGDIWMTTGGLMGPGHGVAMFDGTAWHHLGEEQGLPSNEVYSVREDPEGLIWIATDSGLARYDGRELRVYDERSGVHDDRVLDSHVDRSGDLWVGTIAGVSRLDGKEWRTFGPEDGFPRGQVFRIFEDADGLLWFGTFGGVCSFDGNSFEVYTTEDGLAHNEVLDVVETDPGVLWIATHGGISRFDRNASDGARWSTLTVDDGLSSNDVHCLLQDTNGHLWAGTDGGGVARYNGSEFHSLTVEDGVASNVVLALDQGLGGELWMATGRGLTRFTQTSDRPPEARIVAVVADERIQSTRELDVSRASLIALEFSGVSLKSRPGAMSFRYRLVGHDAAWKTTPNRRVEYSGLPTGDYTFEVLAVDRDLVVSTRPATVLIRIHPPYTTIALAGGLVLAAFGLVVAGRTSYRRRQERDRVREELIETQGRLVTEMNRELESARTMQMALLPKAAPVLEGVSLSGVCAPANHVGGDYYNFITHAPDDAELSIVLADVSGKAMQAATVAMRFTEILRYESAYRSKPEEILAGLDGALRGQMPAEMFVTCAIASLAVSQRRLVLASAGNPEICYFTAADGMARDIRVTGFPLGMSLDIRGDAPYTTHAMDLARGDVVVFTSDGVEDAIDPAGESYDRDRLCEAVQASARRRTMAEAIRDDLLADVRAFSGDTPQIDDLTVVVLRVD